MISVIILTFNSIRFIRTCLDSVFAQDHQDIEVIVVDNGSTDGTVGFIERSYPQVMLIKNKNNKGACRARNQGIDVSHGEWILILDCDTILERDFFQKTLKIVEKLPLETGMLQPKILRSDKETIYSCGIYLSKLRRFYDIGKGEQDKGQLREHSNIFGACTACALFRRKMLEDIKEKTGYFDERFFFLVEDVDLAWRAQKRGWKGMFCPEVICYHSENSSRTSRKLRQYYCFRNRYYSIAKNEGLGRYSKNLAALLMYDMPRLSYLTFTNPYTFRGMREVIKFLYNDGK